MEEIQKGHERSLLSADIFLDDITQFDLNSVTDNFITENLKVAKDHLKTVQSASLYWKEMIGEESILKFLQKSRHPNIPQSIYETSNTMEV